MANSPDPDQLACQKPTDLDLHCLQGQGISGFSRTRVKLGVNQKLSEEEIKCIVRKHGKSLQIKTAKSLKGGDRHVICSFLHTCR